MTSIQLPRQDDDPVKDCCGTDRPVSGEIPRGEAPRAYRFTFKIHGMDCAEEVDALKREVGPLVGGGDRLAFDLLNGKMMVMANAASADGIVAAAF